MSEFDVSLEEMWSAAEPLPVAEVLAVQGLAMSVVRERARRVYRTDQQPRRHRFALLHNSGGDIGSGLTDTYLSVSIGRSDYRQWAMRISFLENVLTEAQRYSNYRELYMFDWLSNEVCWGSKVTIDACNRIIATYRDDTGALIDRIEPVREVTVRNLEVADCDELCERMLSMVTAVDAA